MAVIAEVARQLRHLHHTIEGFETLATGTLIMETASSALNAAGHTMVVEIRSKIGEQQPYWPALSPVTIEDKMRRGYPVPSPLLREGDLRDSYMFEVEEEVLDTRLTIGSTDRVGLYHELGTSKMPPRPVLGPTVQAFAPQIAGELGVRTYRTIHGTLARALER